MFILHRLLKIPLNSLIPKPLNTNSLFNDVFNEDSNLIALTSFKQGNEITFGEDRTLIKVLSISFGEASAAPRENQGWEI